MAGREQGQWGASLSHCIEPKAEKAEKSADPPARKSADRQRRTSCAIFPSDELNRRHRRRRRRTREGRPRYRRARAVSDGGGGRNPQGRWAASCVRGSDFRTTVFMLHRSASQEKTRIVGETLRSPQQCAFSAYGPHERRERARGGIRRARAVTTNGRSFLPSRKKRCETEGGRTASPIWRAEGKDGFDRRTEDRLKIHLESQ